MHDSFAQPNASGIPAALARAIVMSASGPREQEPSFTLTNFDQFSNDLAEVKLRDGRRMIIKRGRYPWCRARFRSARVAGELLQRRARVTAPRSLDLPRELDDAAVDAYWRIELPTLAELWPSLPKDARRGAMRTLGQLIRRVHTVRLQGHGGLDAAVQRTTGLAQHLAEDLGGRLVPSVSAGWEEGIPLTEFLLRWIPEVARRAEPAGVLLHGDLHLGNVLCERNGETVQCVGLLDLESAAAGPAESDLARLSVMHTTLFNMPLDGPWLQWVLDGYGAPVDPVLVGYFGVYHLVQLGNYSASIGHSWHAAQVAHAARRIAAMMDAPPTEDLASMLIVGDEPRPHTPEEEVPTSYSSARI